MAAPPDCRSAREAAEWTRGSLGIRIVNYDDATIAVAAIVTEALTLIRDSGAELLTAVFIADELFGGGPRDIARLEPRRDGRLEVNPRQPFWRGTREEIETRARQYGDTGWWSTSDVRQPIVHELGHLAHWSVSRDTWGAAWAEGSVGAAQRAMAQRVSPYAATEPREFVAEVFAGSRLGRIYSSDIQGLYRRFGGWE